ncbi:hypothetical protein PILCRDRAFT_460488 [Piloderma croceum F 1598]|uniref:Uncharacterized protein n=1 Tax=Piloderma croceum (strain F 1598) TaxID=765440 RepID=A0A0C3FWQ1_PILCF|nr:hypothetical protein PILCRDRAFT_460488 [Piloderma croceum F 1598]
MQSCMLLRVVLEILTVRTSPFLQYRHKYSRHGLVRLERLIHASIQNNNVQRLQKLSKCIHWFDQSPTTSSPRRHITRRYI